jgi:PIN domain nuclease of toxin-antitoxin system
VIAVDSQSIYWYLVAPQRLSNAALEALGAAENDGIVVSAWTIPELWMSATRKRVPGAVPRDAYELVRATLLDSTTTLRVEAFDERMWPHFEAVPLELRDPFDCAVVATALTLGIDLVTSDAAIAAAEVVTVVW